MESTNLHIADLLFEHDCLIVPEFGAFVLSRVPATIDKKRGLMLPPRKEVVFNKHLKHNDGVLVGHVAASCNVSIDEANVMVSNYVDGLHKSIRTTGAAVVEGVGTFRAIGADFAFIADGSANFLNDSYGFAPQFVTVPSQRSLSAPTLGQIRRVAASVAAVACLMLVAPETKDASLTSPYSQASMVQFTNVDMPSVIVADEVEPSAEANVDEVVEESVPQETFYIIVGSFPSDREATSYIASMNKQGVDGLTKMRFGKRVRVAAAQFDDHDEAVRNNRVMRKIKGFENAWVLREVNN